MFISYTVTTDRKWSTQMASVELDSPDGLTSMTLERRDGTWQINGKVAQEFSSCTDVDLGWTPATNTLPIRRLDLAPGASRDIHAAWVRFPQLDVSVSRQNYERLDRNAWVYRSGEYTARLVTDGLGIVRDYDGGLWRTEAVAEGS